MIMPNPKIKMNEDNPRTIQLRHLGGKSLMALSNASVVASEACFKSTGACGSASVSDVSSPVSTPPAAPSEARLRTLRCRSSGGNGSSSDAGDVGDKDALVVSAISFFYVFFLPNGQNGFDISFPRIGVDRRQLLHLRNVSIIRE